MKNIMKKQNLNLKKEIVDKIKNYKNKLKRSIEIDNPDLLEININNILKKIIKYGRNNRSYSIYI